MKIIQNITNYDPAQLDRLCQVASSCYDSTENVISLMKEQKRLQFLQYTGDAVCVACLAVFLGILVTRSNLLLIFIPLLTMLVTLNGILYILDRQEENIKARQTLAHAFFTPGMEYHQFLSGRTLLVCYGTVMDDGRFFATLIALDERVQDPEEPSNTDKICIKPIIFQYDGSYAEGELTLDVGNSLVHYTNKRNPSDIS